MNIETQLATAQMIGSFPTTLIIAAIISFLGYVAYSTYKTGILDTIEKLDKIEKENNKIVSHLITMNETLKSNLTEIRNQNNTIVKLIQYNDKIIKDQIDTIQKKVDSYVFTGKGIHVS